MNNPFAQALSAALEYCIVSAEISREQHAIGFLYREAAVFEHDSGWRFFSGGESDAFCEDTDNFDIVPLSQILDNHPDLTSLMKHKQGAWEWDDDSQQFVSAADWQSQN